MTSTINQNISSYHYLCPLFVSYGYTVNNKTRKVKSTFKKTSISELSKLGGNEDYHFPLRLFVSFTSQSLGYYTHKAIQSNSFQEF